jgi:hypothetical protein
LRLIATLLLINCAALAQTPDLKSVSGYLKMAQKQVAWIERAAEEMPTTFSTPLFSGRAARRQESRTKTTKAELRAARHDAFTYCNRGYDALPMPAPTRRRLQRVVRFAIANGRIVEAECSMSAFAAST